MSTRIATGSVIIAFLLLVAWPADGRAQAYYATGTGYYSYPYAGLGYGGYYGGYGGGTLAEGILRGRAELLQAYGVASLYYAQALRQREEARSLYIDNQLAVREHYAEQRAIREQERQELRTARRQRTLRMAEERREQKARQTADIDWPAELRGDRYAAARTEIEALADLYRNLGGNAGEATRLAVHHAVRNLALQVMEDEESKRLNDEQSKITRRFVRGLQASILREGPSLTMGTQSLAMTGSRQH